MFDTKSSVFYEDGSLREFCIYNLASPMDQVRFVNVLQSNNLDFLISLNSKKVSLTVSELESYFQEPVGYRFSLMVNIRLTNEIELGCHFFDNASIEITIDPKQIRTEEDFGRLKSFINILGREFHQDLHISEESTGGFILLKHDWKNEAFNYWGDWYNGKGAET